MHLVRLSIWKLCSQSYVSISEGHSTNSSLLRLSTCVSLSLVSTPFAPLTSRFIKKLDDASKLTPELLAEKQRVAEENRQKELNKRASVGMRLSKKDRLRREIQGARVSERSKDQSEEIERKLGVSAENRLRHQEETKDRLRRKEEYAKKVRVSLSEVQTHSS